MRTATRKSFLVFKLSAPNGKNHWKIEGRPSGKRERYYFKTEKAAKKGAADRNNQIAAFGTQVALPETERVMSAECIRLLAPYGKTLYDAVHHYRSYLDRSASSISVSELCDRVTDEFARRLEHREISVRHLESMRETLKKFRARFDGTPVKLLDGSEIKTWLSAEPLAVKTRNRHLGYVRNILGIARQWNLLDVDPLERITPFNDPHRKSTQVVIYSVEELQTILSTVSEDWRATVALNAFTGLRRAEVERLDWSEVKLDRKLIDLPYTKSKNGKRKLLDIPGNLSHILTPLVKAEGPVEPTRRFYSEVKRLKEQGIKWKANALRHSFCSYSVASKGFDWTAAQADHSVRMLRDRYWEVVTKDDATKYWGIKPTRK